MILDRCTQPKTMSRLCRSNRFECHRHRCPDTVLDWNHYSEWRRERLEAFQVGTWFENENESFGKEYLTFFDATAVAVVVSIEQSINASIHQFGAFEFDRPIKLERYQCVSHKSVVCDSNRESLRQFC